MGSIFGNQQSAMTPKVEAYLDNAKKKYDAWKLKSSGKKSRRKRNKGKGKGKGKGKRKTLRR
jgi:hypothetical protein